MSASETPVTDNLDAEDDTFNAADADIRLRSSDDVTFAVHRCILRWISPFFADMLSLPQPEDGEAGMIDMSEDAASHRLLLRFSYPRTLYPEPALTEVLEIKRAATLALKFDCKPLLQAVEIAITRLSQDSPETAYAIAWEFELGDVLRAAARASLHRPWFIDDGREVPEFEDLSSRSLILLGKYRSAFYAAIKRLDIDESAPHPIWIDKDDIEHARELEVIDPDIDPDGPQCSCGKVMMGFRYTRDPSDYWTFARLHVHHTPRWWTDFVAHVLADVKKSSIDEAIAKARQTAQREARQCPRCSRLLDFDDALTVTSELLREEIQRQIEQAQLLPPF
ncbi:hypothetical protein PENSPDRAFT_217860 [Peniophora sp. CONT]|nr:hypothetical protein PENSPDRAFT_217860 [Peniophora sp. CONT]